MSGKTSLIAVLVHAVVFVGVLYYLQGFYSEGFKCMTDRYGRCTCFPASALATLYDGSDSGKQVPMEDLKIGDKVLTVDPSTGVTAFSDIYFFGHRDAETVASFYSITTESGKTIQLSSEHYMYVSENGCNDSIVNATTLTPTLIELGMGAWTKTSEGMKCSPIVKIHQSEERGLYAPLTLVGTILVNDIYASSYATSGDVPIEKILSTYMSAKKVSRATPAIWHKLVAPVRALYASYGTDWMTSMTAPYDYANESKVSIIYRAASTALKDSFVTALKNSFVTA